MRIADAIREAITNGQVKPAEALPSSRNLAGQFHTNRHTIMEAMEELVAEGWIIAKERKGYVVSPTLPPALARTSKAIREKKSAAEFIWGEKKIDLEPFQAMQKTKFNFQSGLPDLRIFPRAEFQYYLTQAVKKCPTASLGYENPAGMKELTQALDVCLRRLKNISGRSTIITNGSQEAIYITMQLLVKAGDHVAMEDPGYPPARVIAQSLGARVIPLSMDQDGIIPEQLEAVAKKFPLRLLFLTPLHQFPTTVTLSAPRRIQIYDIAHRYKFPILEDDYDHEFHYRTQPLTPMASEDPYKQIIYLGTLSKLMFPGASLGFMSVPSSFAARFLQYRRLVNFQNEVLVQLALAYWISDGGFERHLNRMRKVYEKRLLTMNSTLEQLRAQGKKISWQKPNGGMAIWLNLNRNSTLVSKKALSGGTFVTPEAHYRHDGMPGTHLRIGFSNQSEEEIEGGLSELGKYF